MRKSKIGAGYSLRSAIKNGKQRPVSQQHALDAAQSLSQHKNLAEKVHNGDPWFKDFGVRDNVTGPLERGTTAYVEGRFAEALEEFQKAESTLQHLLRIFFKGSVEHYFGPALENLRQEEIDGDLLACAEKRVEAVRLAGRRFCDIQLEEATELYWEADKKIAWAREEMARRLENRAQQKREQDLARQQAVLGERQAERAAEMANLFSDLTKVG